MRGYNNAAEKGVNPVRHASISLAIMAFAAAAVPARAADLGPVASSSAFAVSASFTSQGETTGLAPVLPSAGSLPGAYDVKQHVGSFGTMVDIGSGSDPIATKLIATLQVTTGALATEADSAGYGIDNLSVAAKGSAKSVSLTLQLYPPPPGVGVPLSLLSVTIVQVSDTASESLVVPQQTSSSSSAAIKNLSITGTLLGGQSVSFTGSPAANTMVFNNGSVIVTLNARSLVGLISCSPKCTFTPSSIAAEAVRIDLVNVMLSDRSVSGQIVVGGTTASIP